MSAALVAYIITLFLSPVKGQFLFWHRSCILAGIMVLYSCDINILTSKNIHGYFALKYALYYGKGAGFFRALFKREMFVSQQSRLVFLRCAALVLRIFVCAGNSVL